MTYLKAYFINEIEKTFTCIIKNQVRLAYNYATVKAYDNNKYKIKLHLTMLQAFFFLVVVTFHL